MSMIEPRPAGKAGGWAAKETELYPKSQCEKHRKTAAPPVAERKLSEIAANAGQALYFSSLLVKIEVPICRRENNGHADHHKCSADRPFSSSAKPGAHAGIYKAKLIF